MQTQGRHLLLDLRDCSEELLNDLDFLKGALFSIAEEASTPIIGESFHRFEPQGISGAVLISGSHVCIHTWPEYGYAAIDIFTCSDSFQPEIAAKPLIEKLKAKDYSLTTLNRGLEG